MNNPHHLNYLKQYTENGSIKIDDQVSINYKIFGKSHESVVVLHGGPGLTSNYLIPDLIHLSLKWRLIFYDQRGSGISDPLQDENLISPEHMIEDLEKVRQFFNLEKLTLIGHSWGAELACYYANHYPEKVNRMILIGPSCPDNEIMKEFDVLKSLDDAQKRAVNINRNRFMENTIRKTSANFWTVFIKGYYYDPINSRNMWGDVTNIRSEYYQSKNVSVMSVMFEILTAKDRFDLIENLDECNSPVLIIHGEKDPIPLDAAHFWNNRFTNSKLIVQSKSGHFPHIETPEITSKMIIEFLQGKWPDEGYIDNFNEILLNNNDDSDPYIKIYTSIHKQSQKFANYINNQNWKKASELFTENGITFPPSSPPIQGHSGIEMLWETLHNKGMRKIRLQTMEVESSGQLCFEIGKYIIYTENHEIMDIGKFIVIWKQIQDEWKLYRDFFNSSLETKSALEIPDYLLPPYGTLLDG